jgi:hypothetical protein
VQIIAKASKVAQFVSRGWEVGKAGASDAVIFSWARHKTDKTGDEYTISWEVAQDGAMTLQTPYAKTMELGWQAFALSLIASEVTDEEKGPNLRFLHDLTNFNFVTTAQGELGDLLKRGRCTILEPVGVDYMPKVEGLPPDEGDFWRVQLSVNCDVAGPKYLTRDGAIVFTKRREDAWQPQSSLAHRVAKYPPSSWFVRF